MILGDEGRKVNVAELQTVCLIGERFIDKFGKQAKKNVKYNVIPIEESKLLMESADKLKGEICIIEQGLMIYLDDEKRDKMFDGIRDILKKHGGCLITSDLVQKQYFTDTAAALFGAAEAPKLYNETKEMYERVLDDKINDDALQNEQEAMTYLNAHGLRAKKVPLFNSPPNLYITNKLTPAQRQNVNALATKNYLWVITAI